jgi:hypothetical protein
MTNNKTCAENFSEPLSNTELKQIRAFLEEAAGELSQHSCNDFTVRASKENKVVFLAIVKWQATQDWGDTDPEWTALIENVSDEDKTLFTFDNWAMSYFAHRCSELAAGKTNVLEWSSAELNIMAALLDLAVEYREMDYSDHDISVEYTLAATKENKVFFAAVIQQRDDAECESKLDEIMAADDEIAVLDFWIMAYFSARCKRLAATP